MKLSLLLHLPLPAAFVSVPVQYLSSYSCLDQLDSYMFPTLVSLVPLTYDTLVSGIVSHRYSEEMLKSYVLLYSSHYRHSLHGPNNDTCVLKLLSSHRMDFHLQAEVHQYTCLLGLVPYSYHSIHSSYHQSLTHTSVLRELLSIQALLSREMLLPLQV